MDRVLQKHCQSCHRPVQVAPISFLTYRDTRPWAKAIKAAVVQRRMPPWFAGPSVGTFHNVARLSQEEITTLSAWADAPAPLRFADNWFYGTSDNVLSMPKPFPVPATGTVDYQWVVIPPNFQEGRWVKAMEYMPGNRAVVHQLIAFIRKPGSKWLAELKPGEFAGEAPDGTGTPLLLVPRCDFNWQLVYRPAIPVPLTKGSKLWGKAWFDNSPNNPHNPDPNREVGFGDQTTVEMMVGWMLAAEPRHQPQGPSASVSPKYGN